MAISVKDKALVKALMSKYQLTPELTKSGKAKSTYMADIAANQAALNRAYQKATAAERKDIERFVDLHIRRNVDNIKREARRQREAAKKVPDGSVKRSMLRRASEIEQTAKDYKENAQRIQSGPRAGEKRSAAGKIRAYKPAPKVEKLSQKQAVQNMIDAMAMIGITSGVTPDGKQIYTGAEPTTAANAGFTPTTAEAPAEFTDGKPVPPDQKKQPESETTFGLKDLYTIDPSLKAEVNQVVNELMEMYPEYKEYYFDMIEEIRDEKKRQKEAEEKAKQEGTAPPEEKYPAMYGDTQEALLATFETYATKLKEDMQRDRKFGESVPAEVLQAVERAYSRINDILNMEGDI